MEFWDGVLIGVFFGAVAGVTIAALMTAAKRGSSVIENDLGSGEFLRWVTEERKKQNG